ncbi:Crp/Fnr family transcriptional regulator [Aureibaculum algae]|uniref:Crp/Fnr family transcriptional regulator n=1 Tax=Aureibaculum algae TaxID=2584122 RepID=A0A5B7TXL8_9FLAO|nr:Crp/Fnr family transcriptional regulator [Aureibaculum algae]QCX39061.1 Crp/Fnr family transcriptional regulator [Aureibaculum algae]QCX39896.1 Crp/Fnr family transcriptional regulator [Aureibaculum algae]
MIRTNIELLEYIEAFRNSIHYFIEEEIQKEQKIIYQNRNSSFGYIIKNGIAKCFLTDENGNDFIQEFFSEGELFGEIEIINNTNNFCTVESISEMTVYKISKTNFQYLLENDQKFNNLIMKSFAKKIQYKAVRHSYNQLHSIKSNLFRLQQSTLDFMEIISKNDIASYLGISLRSLNRILKDKS